MDAIKILLISVLRNWVKHYRSGLGKTFPFRWVKQYRSLQIFASFFSKMMGEQ